jgi:hypothetical protein
MKAAKLALTVLWCSSQGDVKERILVIQPMTINYHQIIFNGNIIEIDIINNRSTLRTFLEMVVKDAVHTRMKSHGKLMDQYMTLMFENIDTQAVILHMDISLYSYNMSIVDLNNNSDVFKAFATRVVRFAEMCCTMFVRG